MCISFHISRRILPSLEINSPLIVPNVIWYEPIITEGGGWSNCCCFTSARSDYDRGCLLLKYLAGRQWDWLTERLGGREAELRSVENILLQNVFSCCFSINLLKTLLRRISYQVCQYKFHGFSFFLDFEAIINPSFLKTKNCRKCWFLADKDNWFPLLRSPDLATLGRGWRPLWLCNKKKSRPAAKSHKRELGLQERTLGCRHGNFQRL